jgi:NAD(P)-dependent dehydrogenase (short-subunit alcohol dehydrogenase family)
VTQVPENVPPIADWNRQLDGKVALVTGGGDGIGGAISRLFGQHGAKVEIADINDELARGTSEEINADGGSARAHVVDIRRSEDVQRLARDVLEHHGRLDVLVNNVGDFRPLVRFERSDDDDWSALYQVNLRHCFAVTRAFITSMIENRRGTIVNVHSVEGMRGYPGDPVYAAMKAAVAHFTKSLAVRYGRNGIRVNGMGPDLTQTPGVDYFAGYEEFDELWPAWAPVGRLGWPEDQARVALFLASDQSSYVTGHNIPVDGGSKAGGGWFYSPKERSFVHRPRSL